MNKINSKKGHIIIINALLFFALSTTIIFAVSQPIVSTFKITKSFLKSKESFLVANSASNEVLYKLNTNKEIASAENFTLAQGTAVINVSDTGDGKNISISSDSDSYKRNYLMSLKTGEGVSFNYGLQAGQGGFEMQGGAGIIGNIYSNGKVTGSGGPFITGSAISANISDPVAVLSNNGLVNPSHEIKFGGNDTPQDASQSFSVATTTPIASMKIFIKKSGTAWMNNVTVRLVNDNNGKPGQTTLTQGTISASTVTTVFNYLTIPFNTHVSLNSNKTYWIVFDTSTTWGQYYSLGANNNQYSGGQAKTGTWASNNGGTWDNFSPSSVDQYFDLYVGGNTGLIQGISVGTDGVGDAWAHEINNSNVTGNIYCQAGSGNNKACDTSRMAPVQQPWPVSDGNVLEWKTQAESGGATSSINLGSNHTRNIGPVKISGDLYVGSGATLNIDGPVYVTGNVTVSGGAKIRVNPSLGNVSQVIVASGRVVAEGGGQFQGSGFSGSYILLVTTSSCPDSVGCSGRKAIEVSGGTGAVVLNAQNGTIEFTGGAQAKQATAHKIIMSGGTRLIYEEGLINPNFTSGPSGSWTIDSWKEVD